MKQYTGTKTLKALPMTRGEYNNYRGWTTPSEEESGDWGYLVEYLDGGKANDSRHLGYISWSPKDVFERTYKEVVESKLPAYQQRVIEEFDQLNERVTKLAQFMMNNPIWDGMPLDERCDLELQYVHMVGYGRALKERIRRFK